MAGPSGSIIGWDIGGAHLKMALLDTDGRLTTVKTEPCPLWRGLDELDRAIERILAGVKQPDLHAVTMTGELVDAFADRPTGVRQVLKTVRPHFQASETLVFAAPTGFVTPDEAARQPERVASANWLATASFLARHFKNGLLVDVGSTTTDIIPLANSRVATDALTDSARLAKDELVYTGIARTPVMALADRLPFDGQWTRPMAEVFATAADVYRLTGDLPEGADLHPAVDDGEKTLEASGRRLLRMVGRDYNDASAGRARLLADFLAEAQFRQIYVAASRVLSGSMLKPEAPVIGVGVGRFLAARLATRLGMPYRDAGGVLADSTPLQSAAAAAAPAVAVARLALARSRDANSDADG